MCGAPLGGGLGSVVCPSGAWLRRVGPFGEAEVAHRDKPPSCGEAFEREPRKGNRRGHAARKPIGFCIHTSDSAGKVSFPFEHSARLFVVSGVPMRTLVLKDRFVHGNYLSHN